MSTHIVSDVEHIANEVLMMKAGSIIYHGTRNKEEEKEEQPLLEELYMNYFGEQEESYV